MKSVICLELIAFILLMVYVADGVRCWWCTLLMVYVANGVRC